MQSDASSSARQQRVVSLAGSNRLMRLIACLTARIRRSAAARGLRRGGCSCVRFYAVFPDIDAPRLIYELGTAAGTYAEHQLVPDSSNGAVAATRRALRWIAGCDPRAAAILVMGYR